MKKTLSLMLVLVLCTLSFAACGKKDIRKDFFEDLSKSQNFKTGEISMEFNINAPKETEQFNELIESINNSKENQDIFIKLDATIQSTNPVKSKLNLSYKVTKDSEYSILTDIIINDKDFYINLSSLKDFAMNSEILNKVDGINEIRGLLSVIPLNYLKISEKDLLEFSETYMSSENTDIISESGEINYDITKNLLIKVLMDTFKEIENEYKETLIIYEDSTYKINLNASEIKDIHENFKIIVNRDVDKVANELLTTNYGTDIPNDIVIKKDELIKSIKEKVNASSFEDMSDEANINYQFKFKEDKDDFKSIQSIRLYEDETTMDISLSMSNTLNENEIDIQIPENYTTLEDLINSIFSSMFNFME